MIVAPAFRAQCAACGIVSTHATPGVRMPLQDEGGSGLDGRPSFVSPLAERETQLASDMYWIERAHPLTTCPHCGFCAPDLATPYPGLARHRATRDELLASPTHDPRARRWLVTAQLFAPSDPANLARWTLRAAWADEAMGRFDAARPLRRESAQLLEELVCEGSALSPVRGRTSVMLAELYRVSGDHAQALAHCARGLGMEVDEHERILLWFEAMCSFEQRLTPFTKAQARHEYAVTLPAQRMAVLRRIYDTTPAPMVLRPRRHRPFDQVHGLEADATFTHEYLSVGRVAEFLGAGMVDVASAAFASPALTAELFCALDHQEAVVRARALRALENRRPPEFSLPDAAISAILRRLEEDDVATVRAAGLLVRHLVVHAEHRAGIVEVAERLLPKWAHDISTTGVLERIVEAARPASPLVPPTDDCRRPRSIAEMQFLASLGPCPGCRRREDPGANYYTFDDLGTEWRLTWPCSECNATRFIRCPTGGANDLGSSRFGRTSRYEFEAGPFRSQVLGREAFVAELERRLPHVRATPTELAPVEHAVRRNALVWAIRMITELLELPESPPWSHERLAAERARLVAIDRLFAADAPRISKLLPDKEVRERVRFYTNVLGLRGELRALVNAGFATKDPPTAADLRAHLAPKARALQSDVVDLGTDVASVWVSDDARGHARAELTVTSGTIADVETVFGALDAGASGEIVRRGRAAVAHVRVRADGAVDRVVLGFEARR